MVELSFRMLLAGLGVLAAGIAAAPYFDAVWKAAAVLCAYSLFGYRLDVRGLKNAGFAGFLGVADALCLAAVLGAAGQLSNFGFVVLAPLAYAVASQGALPAAMAPLASAGLIASHIVFEPGVEPGFKFYAQVASVLGIGLLLNNRRIIETVTVRVDAPENPQEGPEPRAFMELREAYRKLRDLYSALDVKSRRDRNAVELFEVSNAEGERFFRRMANRVRELSGADSAALYTLARHADTMVVRAESGDFPEALRYASVDVDLSEAAARIVERSQEALRALSDEERRSSLANVLLRRHGRVVGLVCLVCEVPAKLAGCAESVEELAPMVSAAIHDERSRQTLERRARQAELLYDVALTARGAETPNTLAARVLREMGGYLDVDHLGVFWLDGSESFSAAHEGDQVRLLEQMSFADGPGIVGWTKLGYPELVMFDTIEDLRCPSEVALRTRVRSFALMPLISGAKPNGYLTAATRRADGLDLADIEGLRLVSAELGHALARLEDREHGIEGLATPPEFQQRIRTSGEGCLVYLEPLRKAQLLESFGKPAIDNALRQFARRLYGRMPSEGLVCRRSEGDYVAFLPGFDIERATSWANEAAALASFIGITLPEAGTRIPLAMRAKVAPLSAAGVALVPEQLKADDEEVLPRKRKRAAA